MFEILHKISDLHRFLPQSQKELGVLFLPNLLTNLGHLRLQALLDLLHFYLILLDVQVLQKLRKQSQLGHRHEPLAHQKTVLLPRCYLHIHDIDVTFQFRVGLFLLVRLLLSAWLKEYPTQH
jgi:hypothetical protein